MDDLKREIPDATSQVEIPDKNIHVDIPEPPGPSAEPMSTITPEPEPTLSPTPEALPVSPLPTPEVAPSVAPMNSNTPTRHMSELLAGIQPLVEPVAPPEPAPLAPEPSFQATPPPPVEAPVIPAPAVTEVATTPAATNSGVMGKLRGLFRR